MNDPNLNFTILIIILCIGWYIGYLYYRKKEKFDPFKVCISPKWSLILKDYGGYEVETPIMYDSEHPSMVSYFNRFPARQYNIDSEGKKLFLRFAACFGQFLMAKEFQLSYKNLPYRLYELTRYSFRREQTGELVGLRRLRAFTMPYFHSFCKDM